MFAVHRTLPHRIQQASLGGGRAQRIPAEGRRGFTLVELLMVVAIIAILAALITPAVQSAMRRAKIGRVSSEITGLEAACAQFKARYGVNPPSYIVLSESSSGWTTASKSTIRQIWGLEFDFSIDRDLNGDGDKTDTFTLTGDECLVFFLGGMPSKDGSGNFILHGFSHSKGNPFSSGGKRRLRFYDDWDVSRLGDRDGDSFPEYYDIFNLPAEGGRPYLYFSPVRTGTYEISDNSWAGMSNVYYQSTPPNSPWRPGGFQIISPGPDKKYGSGGRWVVDDSSSLSNDDQDNITNFSGGQLEQ